MVGLLTLQDAARLDRVLLAAVALRTVSQDLVTALFVKLIISKAELSVF